MVGKSICRHLKKELVNHCSNLTKRLNEPVEKPPTLTQALKNRKRKANELQSEPKYQASYILASTCCVENHWSVLWLDIPQCHNTKI